MAETSDAAGCRPNVGDLALDIPQIYPRFRYRGDDRSTRNPLISHWQTIYALSCVGYVEPKQQRAASAALNR